MPSNAPATSLVQLFRLAGLPVESAIALSDLYAPRPSRPPFSMPEGWKLLSALATVPRRKGDRNVSPIPKGKRGPFFLPKEGQELPFPDDTRGAVRLNALLPLFDRILLPTREHPLFRFLPELPRATRS